MNRHLNLVKSDFEQLEKRVLPRFPFCYLTFKNDKSEGHVFEVKDISHSGMQLSLKNGSHNVNVDDNIHGELHWGTSKLTVNGNIKWTTDLRLGVEFSHSPNAREEMNEFLNFKNIAKHLKPVHELNSTIEIPAKLKYWLRSDGPVEVFIWQHSDGELARFQVLMMEKFVEWEDGFGLKTARVMSKRDLDTPLITEDEFVFKIDEHLDEEKVQNALTLVENINDTLLSEQTLEFLLLKLRS